MSDAEYAVEEAYANLLKALDRMKRQAKDVIDFPDDDQRENYPYLLNQVMDSAHEILDLAHDFKNAERLKYDK